MNFIVSSPTHSDFVLMPLVPEWYSDEMLPGSETSYAEGAFGKVVVQQLAIEPFNILYNFYDMQEKCVLQVKGNAPPLRIMIAVKGNSHFSVDGAGELDLKQGQFNLVYSPNINTSIIFDQPGDALVFNLYLPIDILQELAAIFSLQEFMEAAESSQPRFLFQKPGWINTQILREISYMLDLPVAQALRPYLFEIKVKQLLHLLLIQKHYGGKESIPEAMLEGIRAARHIIETTVGQILTIDGIAELAGISERDLKKYFKPVVGVGISTFIIQSRLINAKLLVQETDLPIKEIAYIAGYDHEQNFIQAFKQHFDYTPFFVRQRR